MEEQMTEHADERPPTIRQAFYRAVAAGQIEKSAEAYRRFVAARHGARRLSDYHG